MEEQDNYICWASDKPKIYNIVLWNGRNNGLPFKFNTPIINLGLKRDNMVGNITDTLIQQKLENEKKAYFEYMLNQSILNSHFINTPFNKKSSEI